MRTRLTTGARTAGRKGWRIVRAAAGAAAFAVLIYAVFLRPWHLRWGATEAEVGRRMPGDEFVEAPDLDATRAVGIAAPPARVWELLERRARAVLAARGAGRRWERRDEPGRWIVWRDTGGQCSWSWQLEATGDGGTRLITRQRARYPWGSPRLLVSLAAEVLDVLSLRRGLLDIKRQAEQAAGPRGRAEGPGAFERVGGPTPGKATADERRKDAERGLGAGRGGRG